LFLYKKGGKKGGGKRKAHPSQKTTSRIKKRSDILSTGLGAGCRPKEKGSDDEEKIRKSRTASGFKGDWCERTNGSKLVKRGKVEFRGNWQLKRSSIRERMQKGKKNFQVGGGQETPGPSDQTFSQGHEREKIKH